MDELARWLSVESRLLELLLLKRVELDRAMARVQEAELRRSMLVADLARDLAVPEDGLTLAALARDSVEPYRTIFADHHDTFLDLAAEIEGTPVGASRIPSLRDFLR